MKMDYFHKVYDSIEEFRAAGLRGRGGLIVKDYWTGASSWEEIDRLVSHGWAEGVERARRMRIDMDEHIASLGLEGAVETEDYDVSGAAVDVGLYCEGEPECMMEFTEQVMPNSRVVRVLVQINYLSDVSADAAMRRGVAVAGVVDALEAAGLEVELWAVDHTEASVPSALHGDKPEPYRYRHAVQIKRPGEPFPLDRMAFAVGHPGFYRGLSFAVRVVNKGGQNGVTDPFPASQAGPTDLIVPPMTSSQECSVFNNDENACKWACELFAGALERALNEVAK